MTTTLITGANKGLGRETARRLVQAGYDVYLGARDPERGAAAARELGCRFVVLVVLDDDSVTAAADTVEQQQGPSTCSSTTPASRAGRARGGHDRRGRAAGLRDQRPRRR